jgi:hypothetical protein
MRSAKSKVQTCFFIVPLILLNLSSLCLAQVYNDPRDTFIIGAWGFRGSFIAGTTPAIFEDSGGAWQLTSAEQIRLRALGINFLIANIEDGWDPANEEAVVLFCRQERTAGRNFWVTINTSGSACDIPTSAECGAGGTLCQNRVTFWNLVQDNPAVRISDNMQNIAGMYVGDERDAIHSVLIAAECGINNLNESHFVDFSTIGAEVQARGFRTYVECGPGATGTDADRLLSEVGHIDFFHYYMYPYDRHDSASCAPGPILIQQDLDRLITQDLRSAITAVRDHQDIRTLPFYAGIQTHFDPVFRQPTIGEMLCQINLSLAYGARGLIYYPYGSYHNSMPRWCSNPPELGDEEGLLDFSRNENGRYYAVEAINTDYQGYGSLEVIGREFIDLEWQDGFSMHLNTNEPVSSLYNINDVQSRAPGDALDSESDTFVEIGVLRDIDDGDAPDSLHYMIVNRRVNPDRTTEILVDFLGTAGHRYEITNMFNNHITDHYVGSFDVGQPVVLRHSITLGPGEGMLLRVVDRGGFSQVPASPPITNPTVISGTVYAAGNLTVSGNGKLIINPNGRLIR